MYMNLREIILNFYMWMSWTVRLSQTLHISDFVKRLRKKTDITLDCHLMVDRAEDKLDWFDFQPESMCPCTMKEPVISRSASIILQRKGLSR